MAEPCSRCCAAVRLIHHPGPVTGLEQQRLRGQQQTAPLPLPSLIYFPLFLCLFFGFFSLFYIDLHLLLYLSIDLVVVGIYIASRTPFFPCFYLLLLKSALDFAHNRRTIIRLITRVTNPLFAMRIIVNFDELSLIS